MQRVRVTFISGKRLIYCAEKVLVLDFAASIIRPEFEKGVLLLNAPFVQSVEYLDAENTNDLCPVIGAIGAAEGEKDEQSERLASPKLAVFPNIHTKEGARDE